MSRVAVLTGGAANILAENISGSGAGGVAVMLTDGGADAFLTPESKDFPKCAASFSFNFCSTT